MGMIHNVPVQSLIDHIKTAIDVDPWAKEMTEELLKEQEPVEPIKPIDVDDSFTYLCSNCKGELFCGSRIRDKYCPTCGKLVKWE